LHLRRYWVLEVCQITVAPEFDSTKPDFAMSYYAGFRWHSLKAERLMPASVRIAFAEHLFGLREINMWRWYAENT
jgi:hypothetical protein